VIVEPYVGNMVSCCHCRLLAALRELTTGYGAVLIFDEVMTGFRVAPGASKSGGIRPTHTLARSSGGLPVGLRWRAEHHELPLAGGAGLPGRTLSGNPLAMIGLATLRGLQAPGVYPHLEQLGTRFASGMSEVFTRHGVPHVTANRGSMAVFLTDGR